MTPEDIMIAVTPETASALEKRIAWRMLIAPIVEEDTGWISVGFSWDPGSRWRLRSFYWFREPGVPAGPEEEAVLRRRVLNVLWAAGQAVED